MRFIVLVGIATFSFHPRSSLAEECHAVIPKSALEERTLEGRRVYVVDVDDVNPACFKPLETKATIERLKAFAEEAEAAALQSQELVAKYDELNQDYRELVARQEQTLRDTTELADQLASQTRAYRELLDQYDQLVVRFDALAGKYRDVVLTSRTPFSADFGFGANFDGDATGLLGVGWNPLGSWWDLKVWGYGTGDFLGVLGGVTVRF